MGDRIEHACRWCNSLVCAEQCVRVKIGPALRLVVIESPFAGNVERNLRYLRAALRDCIQRGEAPFASHAIYTQPGVLDDAKPEERNLGISSGFEWAALADATVVYEDLGVSRGMAMGIDHARQLNRKIEYRSLPEWVELRNG